ncbi:MAG: hypothetical protein IKV41_03090 [Oscillospiraceae bacterium]|nr:hypothetical protein [Oscillospiraceae bacterium]
MGYTRNYIITKCKEAFKDKNTFYKQQFINYRGKTEDTDEHFSEVIAEFLCSCISEYTNGIDTLTRENSYKIDSHDGVIKDHDSCREEEMIAMKMFEQEYDFIGKIIDYQTPLKNKRSDEAGKIDLLAYDGKTLYILELKKPDSDETMLRCVLEGYTYWKTVDKAKLLKDFKLPAETVVKACPFVFRNGRQHNEMNEVRPHLKQLMDLLGSKTYYVSENYGGKFIVTEK